MRSGLHPLIADAIMGHGDRKKDVKSVYLTISDADLVREIDRMTFDHGKRRFEDKSDRKLRTWDTNTPRCHYKN